MSNLPDLQSCKKLVFYEREAAIKKEIGTDRSKLTLINQQICLKDCTKCSLNFRVQENGLYADNIALFWYFSDKTVPNDYCAGINLNHDQRVDQPYRFCYNDNIIPNVENAVKAADYIRSASIAAYNTIDTCKTKLKYGKNIDAKKTSTEFSKRLKGERGERKKLWNIIEEGIRRLLVYPKDPSKNKVGQYSTTKPFKGLEIRTLHGHELNKLIKQNEYDVPLVKSDIIAMGHFHLQMVLIRNSTWILHTGHFLTSKMSREIGFLSHLGAVHIRITPNGINKRPIIDFELNRV